MQFSDLLLTEATRQADMNDQDWRNELAKLVQRNKAIDAACRGEMPVDSLMDLLAEHLIDPIAWQEAAIENAEVLIYGSVV